MGDRGGADLLDDAIARRAALGALADGPLHRQELERELGVSKTTCHRIIRRFDDHGLVQRTDEGYRLSRLGEVVAGEVDRAARNVETARDLEPLLSAFESTEEDLDVSLFADATVTRAQPEDPYPPVSRFMELLCETDTLRSLDRTSIAPLHVDEIFGLIVEEGLEVEAIYPRSVAEKLLSEYPDYLHSGAELGRINLLVYDDITFGMSLFDDRVGLRAYDGETGAPRLFVDTGDPEALAWAETVFGEYRERARDPDWLPNWVNEPELRLR